MMMWENIRNIQIAPTRYTRYMFVPFSSWTLISKIYVKIYFYLYQYERIYESKSFVFWDFLNLYLRNKITTHKYQ